MNTYQVAYKSYSSSAAPGTIRVECAYIQAASFVVEGNAYCFYTQSNMFVNRELVASFPVESVISVMKEQGAEPNGKSVAAGKNS